MNWMYNWKKKMQQYKNNKKEISLKNKCKSEENS
jgi:hypothetical protein